MWRRRRQRSNGPYSTWPPYRMCRTRLVRGTQTRAHTCAAQARAEIDTVLAGRRVSMADKLRLPYTAATVLEVQRCGNIVPINLQHATKHDVTIAGRHIPAGKSSCMSCDGVPTQAPLSSHKCRPCTTVSNTLRTHICSTHSGTSTSPNVPRRHVQPAHILSNSAILAGHAILTGSSSVSGRVAGAHRVVHDLRDTATNVHLARTRRRRRARVHETTLPIHSSSVTVRDDLRTTTLMILIHE